jgi:pimeloyl-ACP methyl ester carboxylesterase
MSTNIRYYAAAAAATAGLLYFVRRQRTTPRSEPTSIDYPDITTSVTAIRTPSNRTIGFASYGSTSPTARVVFFFHGLPGSRIVPVPGLRDLCTSNDVRLIAIERPGIGLTSPADHGLSTFDVSPEDASHVLKALDDISPKTKVTVVGYSMGGPHALRFTLESANRIDSLHLIAPGGFYISRSGDQGLGARWQGVLEGYKLDDEEVTTPNQVVHTLARHASWLVAVFWYFSAPSFVRGDDYLHGLVNSTTAEDRSRLDDEDMQLWAASTRETFRQGVGGMVQALQETFGAKAPDGWGWDVSKVKDVLWTRNIETHIYAAKTDVLTPLSTVIELADIIGADSRNLKLLEDEIGHLSLLKVALEDIIEQEEEL